MPSVDNLSRKTYPENNSATDTQFHVRERSMCCCSNCTAPYHTARHYTTNLLQIYYVIILEPNIKKLLKSTDDFVRGRGMYIPDDENGNIGWSLCVGIYGRAGDGDE